MPPTAATEPAGQPTPTQPASTSLFDQPTATHDALPPQAAPHAPMTTHAHGAPADPQPPTPLRLQSPPVVPAPRKVPGTPSAAPSEPAAPTPPQPAFAAAAIEPTAKPSFAERAALRRRAKALRARRDAGLLELGAIVLDQRRFGDPTGGSLARRRTDELADIDSELAAIEEVLDDDGPAETVAQLGVTHCLSCRALLGPRDRFCVQCGGPRPSDADVAHAQARTA
ncbi:MAG: hypothetical protein QM679_03280 [Patulibacter sp.]